MDKAGLYSGHPGAAGLFRMHSPTRQTRGDAMSKHPKITKPDSKVDAWAIFFLIVLVVGGAVFWVSGQ